MRLIDTVALVALLAAPAASRSEPANPAPTVGDEYEISKSYVTSEQSADGSSESSGRNAIVELVVGVRADGLELEYDLPKDTTAENRAREWQFPMRVFKPTHGPAQLLNRTDLEARVERWLAAAGWGREVCGRWAFTWTAIRIECDPDTAIKTVEALDLNVADLRDGAPYRTTGASGSGTLRRRSGGSNGASFTTSLEVDPDAVHRARAEEDVVVGEIMQKPVTLDAALRERKKERISGTISVTFDTDSTGSVWRRTTVTRQKATSAAGDVESSTATETVERRLIPKLPSSP